jgi:hypothetical protein
MNGSSDGAIGLVILSLGMLGVVISCLISHKRRFWGAVGVSAVIILVGASVFWGNGFRRWNNSRRIAHWQAEQKKSLKALQEQLHRSPSPGATAVPAAAPAPAAKAPAAPRPRARR